MKQKDKNEDQAVIEILEQASKKLVKTGLFSEKQKAAYSFIRSILAGHHPSYLKKGL